MEILARFLQSQIALTDRPPVGRVELNNEEAEVCAVALDACAGPRFPWPDKEEGDEDEYEDE